jgi:hypothetical protein
MPTATTKNTSFEGRFVELAPAVLAATEPEQLPDRPDAAEIDRMLTAVSELGAAVDHVLAHLGTTVLTKRRYTKASRSVSLARDCARWMCVDIAAAAAALHDDRGEPDDEQDR